MNESVVQEWVSDCTLKQQTVLLAAFRGCDGIPKGDVTKTFAKAMRASILKNADPTTGFYGGVDLEKDKVSITIFFDHGHLDQYPVHWLLHLMHAAEIISYKGASPIKEYWSHFYLSAVKAFHLNPETEQQLDARLSDADAG